MFIIFLIAVILKIFCVDHDYRWKVKRISSEIFLMKILNLAEHLLKGSVDLRKLEHEIISLGKL
jgi:hypothetical protein